MDFLTLLAKNVFSWPLVCFGLGCFIGTSRYKLQYPTTFSSFVSLYLLFAIGFKGGLNISNFASESSLFWKTGFGLVTWAFLQTALSYVLLKKFTHLSKETRAAVSASFGSISLMNFITCASYLESINISYEPFLIVLLAILEIPGIILGLILGNKKDTRDAKSFVNVLRHSLLNRACILLFAGGFFGYLLSNVEYTHYAISPFQYFLCFFLFDLGQNLFANKSNFESFTLRLILFGIYMPLIGAFAGLMLSWQIGLSLGSGVLVTALCASASYIAVPCTMKIAMPKAEESVYLTLALGIAFPFNVIFGTPLYYNFASLFLS